MNTIFRIQFFILFTGIFFISGCSGSRIPDYTPPPAHLHDTGAKKIVFPKNRFKVLCYHDIPKHLNEDRYGVDLTSFVRQLEFLKNHGCHFIGPDDILLAAHNKKPLPKNPVLLTFDDAYLSFYEHVFPLLQLYGYPAVLGVVTGWIDNPPEAAKSGYRHAFMSWDQLREVAASGLVEIATHTDNLHRAVLTHPLGSRGPAAINRIYRPGQENGTGTYETEQAYRTRLEKDLAVSASTLKERLGVSPRVVVWPYGACNGSAMETAESIGAEMTFTLDNGFGDPDNLMAIPRFPVVNNPSLEMFSQRFYTCFSGIDHQRIIHVDLDRIYDEDDEQCRKNLDHFIQRMYDILPSAVYLQAFCDADGDGNASSVYFPNRVLPVRADFFGRVARSLMIRGIRVYAWLPLLSFDLPDSYRPEELWVRECRHGRYRPADTPYKRLSPFSNRARELIVRIYEDLAVHCDISGVVFQDDGYLNDFEDFHPDALQAYQSITGDAGLSFSSLRPSQRDLWTDLKTDTLISLTEKIKEKVCYYRFNQIRFARIIYAPVLTKPASEEWFAQNYEKCLDHYDYVVVMAYPEMEGIHRPGRWLKSLVKVAGNFPGGLDKTVFKVQAYDWNRRQWIPDSRLRDQLRILLAAGARHVAYYPDDFIDNRPDKKLLCNVIGTRDFPFKE